MHNSVWLGVAIALAGGAAILYSLPASAQDDSGGSDVQDRGFRNNNPLNMRYIPPPHNFNGQMGNDNGYGVYDTTANGVRAAGKQLTIDYNAGLTTIAAIIAGSPAHGGWAPSSENDTAAYIDDVSTRMGVPSDQQLAWPGDQLDLVAAIIWHENGSNPYDPSTLQEWLNS